MDREQCEKMVGSAFDLVTFNKICDEKGMVTKTQILAMADDDDEDAHAIAETALKDGIFHSFEDYDEDHSGGLTYTGGRAEISLVGPDVASRGRHQQSDAAKLSGQRCSRTAEIGVGRPQVRGIQRGGQTLGLHAVPGAHGGAVFSHRFERRRRHRRGGVRQIHPVADQAHGRAPGGLRRFGAGGHLRPHRNEGLAGRLFRRESDPQEETRGRAGQDEGSRERQPVDAVALSPH
mmetsp:Transcript_4468/g.14259  ORF Transcript_4468/g.14259 Transcript_4468/m.14259 type:complete len:234 (+) Transcript_4468:2244-2945(+)